MMTPDARRTEAVKHVISQFYGGQGSLLHLVADALDTEARAAVEEYCAAPEQLRRAAAEAEELRHMVLVEVGRRLRTALTLDPETAGRLWHEERCLVHPFGGWDRRQWDEVPTIHHRNDAFDADVVLARLRAHAGLEAHDA